MVAGTRIEEMTSPSKEDERIPKVSMKPGIFVTGPMVPVSRPLRRPPTETVREADR